MVEKLILISLSTQIIFSLGCLQTQGQTNHAIVIGVDKYENWRSPTKLKNNIDSIIHYLESSNKYNFELTILRNRDATLNNIRNTLKNFNVGIGDNIMIYLTGHGSQIDDDNGDEKDKKDEVYVCYDSPKSTDIDFSKKVLKDDDLNLLLVDIRKKIGPAGQVFMVVECCHSSTLDRNGNEIGYNIYSKKWDSAFFSEDIGFNNKLAPLIVFSSSRAFNPTAIVYEYSLSFLSVFREFVSGSYYNLFNKFYIDQRKKHLAGYDIELTVNLHVESPYYLRLGVFVDSVYSENTYTRIIKADRFYPHPPIVEINKGIFEGITEGTILKIVTDSQLDYKGEVVTVKNTTSEVLLDSQKEFPSLINLYSSSIEIEKYNFNDTLIIGINDSVPKEFRATIFSAINRLHFVKIDNEKYSDYSFKYVKGQGLFLVRNRDNIGLIKVEDPLKTLIQLQISHFIRELKTSKDTTLALNIYNSSNELLNYKVINKIKSSENLSIYLSSLKGVRNDRFFCILHIEDEFIKQLVPVNFQINDSECRIPPNEKSEILIGYVEIGNMDGEFMLITSPEPFDLRQALYEPFNTHSRSNQELNEIEKLINQLFLNYKSGQELYSIEEIKVQKIQYSINK